MEEKRRNKRMELDINVKLGVIDEDVDAPKRYVDVEITDVSKSGIGFKSKEQLLIGECFDARITIWTKEVIDSVIKVVRATEEENTEGLYSYGCIFVGMTDTDSLKIQIYQMFNEKDDE